MSDLTDRLRATGLPECVEYAEHRDLRLADATCDGLPPDDEVNGDIADACIAALLDGAEQGEAEARQFDALDKVYRERLDELSEMRKRAKQAELALAKCERQKRGLASAADKGVQAAMRVLALDAEVERLKTDLRQAEMKADSAKSGWLGEVQRRELAEAEARKADARFRSERRLRQAADSALAQALRHPNSKLDHVADYLYRLEHLARREDEPAEKEE